MNHYALGIDLGTSAIKLVVLDGQGIIIAQASAEIPMIMNVPGQAEQAILSWRNALNLAARRAQEALGADKWAQIGTVGLAAQLPTLVCVGADGVLPNAITWVDARADDWAKDFIDKSTRSMLYQRTGMLIDGRYLAPMFRFHHGSAAAGITTLLSAKDWLYWALTGQLVTDPSTAAGYGVFDLNTGDWADDLCALWGVDKNLLPRLMAADEIAGPLTLQGGSLLGLSAGILVYVGAADSVTSAFALGGRDPGTACVIMGSSTIVMGCAQTKQRDVKERYLVTPHVQPGLWGQEMDLLHTGTGYSWLTELLGLQPGALDGLAAESVPGARGVSCAPYLGGGEQGAIWDPSLSGVLHGLNLVHNRADIARAFLESVQYEIRRCVDILAEAEAVNYVVVAGKITQYPSSMQMLADILGRPIRPVQMSSPAAYGAAFLTLTRAKLEQASTIEIRPRESAQYQQAYLRHLELFPRIAKPAFLKGSL